MRILYHHRTQGRGAEGNHIVSIVTALRSLGHEVDVLSPPGVDPFDRSTTLPVDEQRSGLSMWSKLWKTVSYGMPKWLFELAEMFYNIPEWFRLRSALRVDKYDLLYERYAFYLIAGALAARRMDCQFLIELNDISGLPDKVRPQIFPRLCRLVEQRIFKHCDVAHVVSSYLGERLISLPFPRERIVVAPNAFERERIVLRRERTEMRRSFGLEANIVLGFAGWFVAWDRLDFLFDVFADALSASPTLKLCLVGDGEPLHEIRQRLRNTPLDAAFVHTGAVPRGEVYDFIQMFDIGIIPHSNLFGSPMIMFEMMGLKVPVIAPRLPPIEDVHRHERSALLFEPLNQADCVRQILRLSSDDDLRHDLADTALDLLVTEHTWRKTAECILNALPKQNTHRPNPRTS